MKKLLMLVAPLAAALLLATSSATAASASVVYDNIPDLGNVPSVGYEASAASEFGGQIELAGTERSSPTITVLMSSWGCEDGAWNTGDCMTGPGDVFATSVTLKLYDVGASDTVGSLIAMNTDAFFIPYRPSKDDANCTGGDAGKWYSAADTACYNGFATPISFDFPGVTLPDKVIVAVAYDTTHYGYHPFGEAAGCYTSSGGCGYDSLNVGTWEGPPAPGSYPLPDDAYFNSSFGPNYCDGGVGGTGTFRLDAGCWTGLQPAFKVEASVAPCTTDCYVDAATGDDANSGASPADAKKTIQAAVDQVSVGGTVHVAAGSYAEEPTVAKAITLEGAQPGLAVSGRTFGDAAESTLTGRLTIGAAVTVDGFSFTNPSLPATAFGITVKTAGTGTTIENNLFAHISSTLTSGSGNAQAIYLENGPDDVSIADNSIDDVSSNRSAKGILVGDTTATDASTGLSISGNTISSINSDARGAYGIQTNNGTGAELEIADNVISGLTGEWAHAIGLEGDTPSASVHDNTISDITDRSPTPNDAVAVWFEDDPSFSTAEVHQNNLTVDSTQFGIAVSPALSGPALDGTCNWYGDASGPGGSGPGSGSMVGPNVDFAPWLVAAAPGGACTGTPPPTCNGQFATIVGGPGNNTINGTDGDDVIVDLSGNNTINPKRGDDTVCTGPGNDTVNQSDGNDWIDAGDGKNKVSGGDGNDTITTGSGVDTIAGGDGDDTISSGGGNDKITGSNGNDTIDAGEGTNNVNAGDGNDTITTGAGNDKITAGYGNDTIDAGDGNNNVNGGGGNDQVTTGSGDDKVVGGDGDDQIDAGNGNNNVNAGDGNDSVTTGTGKDTVNAGQGDDTVDAGDGNNTVNGGSGDDTITTGSGDDKIDGMAGYDTCHHGTGTDTVKHCESVSI